MAILLCPRKETGTATRTFDRGVYEKHLRSSLRFFSKVFYVFLNFSKNF